MESSNAFISIGLFRRNRLLLRRQEYQTPFERAVGTLTESEKLSGARGSLELNLFEDPTGGLTDGPAEELSTTEIENEIRILVSSFSLDIFYLLYTSFVDIVKLLVEEQLVPRNAVNGSSPVEQMVSWFYDGPGTLKDPSYSRQAMGAERWQSFTEALREFYGSIEEVMPLTRVVRKYALNESIYVPFLRQLAMNLIDVDKRRSTVTILPGLVLGLANGRAPEALELPQIQEKRALWIAELLLGVGQETGCTDLAYLGIQLLRANDIPTPFIFQKQLTNVFSAAARIETDWQVRTTGQLVECYPRWTAYYKEIAEKNKSAFRRIQAKYDDKALNVEGANNNKDIKLLEKEQEEEEEEEQEDDVDNDEHHDVKITGRKEKHNVVSMKMKRHKTKSAKKRRKGIDVNEDEDGIDSGNLEQKDETSHHVENNNFEKLNVIARSPSTSQANTLVDLPNAPYEYFASRRREDVERIVALEKNVEHAIIERHRKAYLYEKADVRKSQRVSKSTLKRNKKGNTSEDINKNNNSSNNGSSNTSSKSKESKKTMLQTKAKHKEPHSARCTSGKSDSVELII